MTAIAASTGRAATTDAIRNALAAMHSRGGASDQQVTSPAAMGGLALGAGRFDWERGVSPHGGGIAHRDGVTVVADATLYHVDDLARAMPGVPANATRRSAAELIIAAYVAFGADCLRRLEGDFAFVLWDGARERMLAARDFAGKRTLFHARCDDGIVVASTVAGVLAHYGVRRAMDLATVASVAAGMWTHTDRTAWEGVCELRAGQALSWSRTGDATTWDFWQPPDLMPWSRQPLDDAAAELRSLLARATEERIAPSGPTSVSLSGGWDSTAVYAAGQQALSTAHTTGGTPAHERSLAPVSISYPAGDPGREDELIRDVVDHWSGATRFIDVDGIALVERATEAAAARDQPLAHAYEHWNRALAREARAAGARVILDGIGGDQLFQVSDIFLSDLLRRGRWIELARQVRARSSGAGDVRAFYRWAVRPLLPSPLLQAIARLRRSGVPRHYLDRQPSFWFRRDFLARHGLEESERRARPALPRWNAVLAESHAFLRFAFYQRIVGMLHAFGVEEGVEVRSPLLDERVVRFALQRPWSERADGAETKILLRRAMRGLLPDHVLAPRRHRTGVTSAYFLRQLRGPARPLVEGTLFLPDSRLASLGMVDARALRRAWEHVLAHDDDETGARLFFTLQAELWLRGQDVAS